MRACVFGATGGIGSALCECLAQSGRFARIYAGGRSAVRLKNETITNFAFDLLDERTIASAAYEIGKKGPLDLVIVATGMLQTEELRPEKSWRALDATGMSAAFAINATGPALIAKHTLPLLRDNSRSVFAALSARVGSIEDNRLGGWHSYRSSKAALNQLVRNFAIELERKKPGAIAVALHPGTVDTPLSRPFQRGVPSAQLVSPRTSAANLLQVIDELTPDDTGLLLAWDGSRIPF
ncbi:MAG: SDR family NAD(P)-dependent oxidoreductase [Novosphingobium sp.]|nr:SDR family NAD(P)-dependent oxidoreductase [Novosphingobium sp.]